MLPSSAASSGHTNLCFFPCWSCSPHNTSASYSSFAAAISLVNTTTSIPPSPSKSDGSAAITSRPLSEHWRTAVRARVEGFLAGWRGEDMPLDSAWLEEALGDLRGAERAAARLGLLTAVASYRVSAAEIEAFRRQWPGANDLLRVCAWGAFAATRRIGSWLRPAAAT